MLRPLLASAISTSLVAATACSPPAGTEQPGVDPAWVVTESQRTPTDPAWPTAEPAPSAEPAPTAEPSQRPSTQPPPREAPAKDTPREATPPPAEQAAPRIHIVQAGESLWRIASQHTTTAADTSALVTQLYAHNREVIGPNPHLIIPGQRLEVPR